MHARTHAHAWAHRRAVPRICGAVRRAPGCDSTGTGGAAQPRQQSTGSAVRVFSSTLFRLR